MVTDLTQEDLREQLHYEQDDGTFKWKVSSAKRVKVGDVAGTVDSVTGYRRIRINGKRYFAHRLAFLYMAGEFPPEGVDHINHDRLDNRWVNLRPASQQENNKNVSMSVRNKSGFTGVHWYKPLDKWMANIKINGKSKHLGYFKDLDEAIACRKEANTKYGFHQNHGY
jgi:hypothetical protein